MTESRFSWHQIVALGLVMFTVVMTAVISRTVFERMPHLEDELAYLYQARIFAQGDVVVERPEPWSAFWQPFVIGYRETGNSFGKYTPGWPLLLSLGVNAGQMWVINAFFAALTVALTYRLGREVFNPDVGVIAGALVAFSPMALLLNASLMGHTAALCLFSTFMYAYWRITRERNALLWGVVAGVALGILIITRSLTAVGVTVPFVVWSVWRLVGSVTNPAPPSPLSHKGRGEETTTTYPQRQFNELEPDVVNAASQNPESDTDHVFAQTQSGFRMRGFFRTLAPLIALGVIALSFAPIIPAFNYTATGDAGQNLYTLIWEYDRVGFGTCCGRSSLPERGGEGHTIVKGIRHMRFDLSLTAADLFGWTLGEVDNDVQDHLRTESDYFPLYGLSWVLLPLGLVIGLRQRWAQAWGIFALILLVMPFALDMDFLRDSNATVWNWLALLGVWMLIPPFVLAIRREPDPRPVWTWVWFGVVLSLIAVQLAYWIGSQRYSTRYYFEMLSAFAMLSAIPLAWVARQGGVWTRGAVYGVLALVLAWSLFSYSQPRIEALYRFNFISPDQIAEVEARREGDRPVLVIVSYGEGPESGVRWRSYGSLMTITDPYLDNDIIVARNYADGVRDRLIAQFPERQVIDLYANGNTYWFADEVGGG